VKNVELIVDGEYVIVKAEAKLLLKGVDMVGTPCVEVIFKIIDEAGKTSRRIPTTPWRRWNPSGRRRRLRFERSLHEATK
jgi:hypothetical protein